MWHKAKLQVETELEQLHHLLRTYSVLINHSKVKEPDQVELLALAALLNSFYTGLENLFKRIVKEIDKNTLQSISWHRDLLDQVSKAYKSRPSVITESTKIILLEYLSFRHVFRQAYSFQIQWEKMKMLIYEMENVLEQIENELNRFFRESTLEE